MGELPSAGLLPPPDALTLLPVPLPSPLLPPLLLEPQPPAAPSKPNSSSRPQLPDGVGLPARIFAASVCRPAKRREPSVLSMFSLLSMF